MKRIVAGVVAVAAVLVVPGVVHAWGEAGHRITGEVAALKMPPSTPAFFRSAFKQLAYLNPEPDRWRDRAEQSIDPALDGGTAPEHFIDMEMATPAVLTAALKAPNRFAYLDTLAAAGIKGSTMGLLPFRMLELSQQLREDFRNWRAAPDSVKPWVEARIIDVAGILGHYVADGSNPTHTSIEYNGWTGANPNGYATDKRLHSRFESAYVQANIKVSDVLPAVDTVARVLPDLRAAIIAYLKESNSHVEQLYQIDKAHPFDANSTSPEDKAFVVERLAAGARMLRDIWYTAWVTSGAPANGR
ncbi:MAG: nuclease [Gemmatimonadaceae bacterium]